MSVLWSENGRNWERKPGMYISGWKLLKAFIVIAGIAALPWLVVYAVAAYFGIWP